MKNITAKDKFNFMHTLPHTNTHTFNVDLEIFVNFLSQKILAWTEEYSNVTFSDFADQIIVM